MPGDAELRVALDEVEAKLDLVRRICTSQADGIVTGSTEHSLFALRILAEIGIGEAEMQHDPDYDPGDPHERAAKAERESFEAREAIRHLIALVPEWARKVEPGLCATMYGTGTFEGDERVKERVDAVKAWIDREETDEQIEARLDMVLTRAALDLRDRLGTQVFFVTIGPEANSTMHTRRPEDSAHAMIAHLRAAADEMEAKLEDA
jgi:hypothetical protein